ncbi:MAG TPA: hypothetical protein VJ625_15355 [Propionibacteriaceae bacterium]|nr:hypothetical protein [Propionibacteriaceae bacterium]
MSSCPDCGLNVDPDINPYIDHCHGTLVVHLDRSLECTDAACQLPELLRHKFVIDCMAVLGGCCVADESADLPAAS